MAQQSIDAEIARAIARIQAGMLAFVFATLGGLGVFLMTAWLLVKGGQNVGLHLQLLGNYFWGYSVSWPGCFVGLFYGALLGGLSGWAIGALYNLFVTYRHQRRWRSGPGGRLEKKSENCGAAGDLKCGRNPS
jgi:hypothetical protein